MRIAQKEEHHGVGTRWAMNSDIVPLMTILRQSFWENVFMGRLKTIINFKIN